MKRDEMKTRIKELKENLGNITPEEMVEFSKSWVKGRIAGVYNYSMFNFYIANMQLFGATGKTATALAPFTFWSKKGRRIKAGSKALQIFAPIIKNEEFENEKGETEEEKKLVGYRIVNVFDFTQTEGDLSQLDITKGGLVGNWTIGNSLVNLSQLVDAFGIKTNDVEITSGATGWTNGKEIFLVDNGNENTNIATYIHELAHCKMHFDKDREKYTRESKEIEAETVAYIVCSAIGLDHKFAKLYLKNWSGFNENVRQSKIISTSESILKTLLDKNLISLDAVN